MLRNQTMITEFILLGFGEFSDLQLVLFLVFLLIYAVTMSGNLLIVALVVSDRNLHTPMYFFLGNLSILEASSSSNILPRMLSALWTGNRRIPFSNCFAQWYFCGTLGVTECCLLCAMSYDRYLAICNPLHYATSMNIGTCILLATVSWLIGFTVFLIFLILMLTKLNYCGPNIIDHYFCDQFPLLKLSCTDATFLEIMTFFVTASFVFVPFLLTLTSYISIVAAILRIPSSTGRQKAFSTCSSHLVVVSLFYGSLVLVYMLPKGEEMRRTEKFSSLFYTVLSPLANPFIYSLRNKDVINSLKIILSHLYHTKESHKQLLFD